jgi:hypothetical protein
VEPGKYYLGPTEGGFVAVLKCEDNGNLTVEDPVDDISKKRVDDLLPSDREFINNYEYGYDNKEDALSGLADICT